MVSEEDYPMRRCVCDHLYVIHDETGCRGACGCTGFTPIEKVN